MQIMLKIELHLSTNQIESNALYGNYLETKTIQRQFSHARVVTN